MLAENFGGQVSMRYKKDAELYLRMYPELEKWMNECSICHSKGYKSDMPEHISSEGSAAAGNIRRYFRPLEVDENGICLQCAECLKKRST
ncbi:MAG: hypothetical protein GX862_11800 [Leucobacter sp.]|nr:hypothetical protein [Leucobacter sp.]